MAKIMLVIAAGLAVMLAALATWQWADERAVRAAWKRLAAHQPVSPARFDTAMVAGLPEPAQRFFHFAIRPGTPLYSVAVISMDGEISLGDGAQADYQPMRAEQILAAPHGFIWKVRGGDALWFTGSDGAEDGGSWSQFRLLGLVPVARAGGNSDHARAAFGRYVAEAVFWTPAAVLPGPNVRWSATDASTARVEMTHMGLEQAVDISVDAEGRPASIRFQRWSDANPEKIFLLQPFGGHLSDFREFGGFRLPTRIEAGNFFGTDDFFPFFKAQVTAVQFPVPGDP